MQKEKHKGTILFLICAVFVFSIFIINSSFTKNFAYIDYPFQAFTKCFKLDIMKNLSIVDFPHVSSYVQYIPFAF